MTTQITIEPWKRNDVVVWRELEGGYLSSAGQIIWHSSHNKKPKLTITVETLWKNFGGKTFRLSIKIESTILKSIRWNVLGRVGLLSADIGLLIEAANFVLALVLLQCFKRTSWLLSGVLDSNSLTRLHWSHKITGFAKSRPVARRPASRFTSRDTV